MFKFNGFTDMANKALNLAVDAAQELGHDYIGSEHLMLGLLKGGEGVAYTVPGIMSVCCGSASARAKSPLPLPRRALPPGPSRFCRLPPWPGPG